jgi:hypothetical protein
MKIADVTDAIYYSKAGRFLYSKPETFQYKFVLNSYPSRPNETLSFANKIGYKDFFEKERFTASGEIQNKMSLTYSKENLLYLDRTPRDTNRY